MYSSTEIAERKAVWSAFSDLFLDTDVTLNYHYIIRVCGASKLTMEELEYILKYEVAPVALPNLYCVAGEWAGFDEEWLITEICKLEKREEGFRNRVSNFLSKLGMNDYTAKHWLAIAPQIQNFRRNA